MNVLWLVLAASLPPWNMWWPSLLLMVTIVGIPFGMQTLKLAGLALWPFGKEVRTGERSGGCLYVLMNVLWILLGGIWIALSTWCSGHCCVSPLSAYRSGCSISSWAALALVPFGKDIVQA